MRTSPIPLDPPRPATRERRGPCVAVLGATGLVGRARMRLLAERDLPVRAVVPLASSRTPARTVPYAGVQLPVEPVSRAALARADIVLASAGGDVSRRWLPQAAEDGAVCIDNTSAFRMDPAVPLIVPEVTSPTTS